jgi:hypothetical protein
MTEGEELLVEALQAEALKYMDCGLLDEAADVAAVVELIESGAAPWCPVNFEDDITVEQRPAA